MFNEWIQEEIGKSWSLVRNPQLMVVFIMAKDATGIPAVVSPHCCHLVAVPQMKTVMMMKATGNTGAENLSPKTSQRDIRCSTGNTGNGIIIAWYGDKW